MRTLGRIAAISCLLIAIFLVLVLLFGVPNISGGETYNGILGETREKKRANLIRSMVITQLDYSVVGGSDTSFSVETNDGPGGLPQLKSLPALADGAYRDKRGMLFGILGGIPYSFETYVQKLLTK